MEPEEKGFVLPEKFVDMNIIDDGFPSLGKVGVKGNQCIEESVYREATSMQVCTKIA